ncbi:MAG: DUF6516 family protein [Chloroflexota bacterium]
MSATTFIEYAQSIQALLHETISTGSAHIVDLHIDPRSNLRGYIAGSLQFNNASELHFREFIDVNHPTVRVMYAYHYQDRHSTLIFRYDNAAHKPPLLQADHKHTPNGVELVSPPTLWQVLDEIL